MHCDDYDDNDDIDDVFGQNKNKCEADGDHGNESPSFKEVLCLPHTLPASLVTVFHFHFLHSSVP